jgi:CRISPR system Cascade subunit CasA
MNLIDDPWLPFRHRDGSTMHAPPAAVADPGLVDLAFPRADFNGAGWQFLIGLLQTAFAPANRKEWLPLWQEPPSREAIQEALIPFREAFELFGDGPRFMQDLDRLEEAREASAASLLIEAPGAQGIKFNTDHFVKRGVGEAMCPSCTAMALFNFQTTGPAGGTGYRVGIRGGGPLTTLVLPHEPKSSLWEKALLNLLPRDNSDFHYPDPAPGDWRVFPWLAATRTSEKGSATPVTSPEDVHQLHVFWAMPNRIRLEPGEEPGTCQVCGGEASALIRSLRMANLGYNYEGPWQHPLTPYRFNPKKPQEPPISQKGQQGGLGYRHWESLVLEDTEDQGNLPALVVQDYLHNKRRTLKSHKQPRLWAFGYDLKQNKPRGWYSTEMPLIAVSEERTDVFLHRVRELEAAAQKAGWRTREAVKAAWFSRPGDVKGDFDFIQHRFWEATAGDFYACLAELAPAVEEGANDLPSDLARRWQKALNQAANGIFEDLALSGDAEAMDLKRVIGARNQLRAWLNGGKEMKNLRRRAEQEETA